jgi:flavin-dependent dehydrogenase
MRWCWLVGALGLAIPFMAEQKVDVLILGAGPGGLSAARELAAAGREVLVLDKTRVLGRKVCAGNLPLNRDVRAMGIPDHIITSRVTQLSLATPKRTRNISYADEPRISFTREALGQWMAAQAQEAGARIRIGVRVTRLDGRQVITADNEVISYDTLIGADGSMSLVRRHLGLPFGLKEMAVQSWVPGRSTVNRLKLDRARIGVWPAYALPNGNYTVCGVGGDAERCSVQTMKVELARWIAELGYAGSYRQEGFPLCITYRGHQFGNIFLVGDAAGLMNDITGIGIYPAWLSGQEVARQILDPSYRAPRLQALIRSKRIQRLTIRLLQRSTWATSQAYEFLSVLLSLLAVRTRFFSATFGGHHDSAADATTPKP